MNRPPVSKRVEITFLLMESMNMRAISRVADCSLNIVTKLLIETGAVCLDYQDTAFHNLPCEPGQCDELWGFCGGQAEECSR